MICNKMGRIVITKGDDTDAFDATLQIILDTEEDLTDCTACFQLGPLHYDFEDITSKELDIVISKADSLKLNVGLQSGALKIYDADGKGRTVLHSIPFEIKPQVVDND